MKTIYQWQFYFKRLSNMAFESDAPKATRPSILRWASQATDTMLSVGGIYSVVLLSTIERNEHEDS